MQIMAPISIGELLDKITILSIKVERIVDESKRENAFKELIQLKAIADEINPVIGLPVLYDQLLQVNSELWDIENKKRNHEKLQLFNDEFIQLARNVYIKNDIRAKIKRDINVLLGSSIIEEKSY
jgi:hypothetical protein